MQHATVGTVYIQHRCQFHCHMLTVTVTDNEAVLCGMQHATTLDGGLEMYPGAGTANIGIMLFRTAAKVFAEVLHTLPCTKTHPNARFTPAMLP